MNTARAAFAERAAEAEGSSALLRGAEEDFTTGEMAAYAASLRRWRGELTGGDEGRELVETADTRLRELGIASPERMARLFAPRFG